VSFEKTHGVKDVRALAGLLERSLTFNGENLAAIAARSPTLLVFLRHAGCTFCRETLADIARLRKTIEGNGLRIVIVHMGDTLEVEQLLAKNDLLSVDRICDPQQELYQAFGLKQGSLSQLFGPKVWWRGIAAGLFSGHGVGKPEADSSQMPGVFLLENGMITRRFRHRSAADRPDYADFCVRSTPIKS
jgi:hypothetical protein